MRKTTTFILTALVLCLNTVFAQEATIKGVVLDGSNNDPLIGVNVIIKGTSIGAATGLDGDFSLKVTEGKNILVFTYLGYETKEETVQIAKGETKSLRVLLSEEASILTTTVISASRYEKKLGEETVSLDVIKPAFIENQNLVTLDDAIERSPGVTVIDGQVNIRGGAGYSYGAGSRVLLLLDDLPILQADAGFPNWSSIPMENIGQIEIIKGAASALYGSSAMNGIINVRTAYATGDPVTKISTFGQVYRNPRKEYDDDGNQIRKDWWNFDQISIDGTPLQRQNFVRPYESGINFGHRQKFGKFDLVLGSQFVSAQDHLYGAYETRGRVSVQTRYRINEKMNFGINSNIQKGKSGSFFLWNGNDGVNKYLPLSITGEPTTTKAFRATIDPFFNFSDDKGNKHKILGRWYKVDNDNDNDQGNFSNFFYGEYQYQKRLDKINLTISGGAVASYVTVDAPLYGGTYNGRNFAVYAQLDKKFFDKLNVSLGGRLESNKITDTDAETRPVVRVGANYQAAEYTFIRASFGQGFRFPTIAEKFINTSLGETVGIIPNPDLIFETGMSAELGIKQGIKIGKFSAFLDLAGFFTRYFDMMEFNPSTNAPAPYVIGFQSQNVGNTQIIGLETNLMGEGKLFNKFQTTAMLGYTYIIPKYLDYNDVIQSEGVTDYNVLKYRFRHTFTGAWDINFNGVDFGISGRYFSFMENIDNVFTLFITGLNDYRESRRRENYEDKKPQRQYKGDFILDLRLGYTHIGKNKNKYKITALANNVMNKEYSIRPGLVEAPASYTLRLDLEF